MASEPDDRAKDMLHQDLASIRRKDIPHLVRSILPLSAKCWTRIDSGDCPCRSM